MNEINPGDIQKMQEFEVMKKNLIRKLMTKDAVERMGRIRLVKPELAEQLELYLIQLYQSGEIKGMIDDKQLRGLLDVLTAKKQFK
ncbi:MAG: hypothetical protein GW914_02800, partial [Candidatus Aenigmarchaeota archaeon]|nr:hypothetical protein [Candidatus Aenigmarchaeota archaeon]